MKKIILFMLLSAIFFTNSDKCHAQFLKKLAKGIENVSKKLDETLGTTASAAPSGMTVSSPHKDLKVNVLNATYNGDEFLLEFTITNMGADIKGYCLMDGNSEKTIAFDNLGNQCSATLLFGNARSKNKGYAENTLFNGIPVKVVVTLTKYGADATSFSQIKIGAGTDIWNVANFFVFKNVPIIKEQEQEVVIPVKEAEKPQAAEINKIEEKTPAVETQTAPVVEDYTLSKDQMNGWKAEGLLGKVQSVKYSTGKQVFFNTVGNPSKIINGKEIVTRTYTASNPAKNSANLKITYGKNTRQIQDYYGILDQCGLSELYTFDNLGRIAGKQLREECSGNYEEKYIYNGTADRFPAIAKGSEYWETGDWAVTRTYQYMEFDNNGNWTKRKVNEVAVSTDYDTEEKTSETKNYVETATYVYY